MNTNHTTNEAGTPTGLLLYATLSTLLPYAAAAILLLLGQPG